MEISANFQGSGKSRFGRSEKGHYFLKIPKWQHKFVWNYKRGKLVSYFLNNAVKTWLYGLKVSENIEIEHVFQSKALPISTEVASVPWKSYYQLSYVSVWLTGIFLNIANILIKSWNVHFHITLDWNNAAWPIWWLKQLIKPCKLTEAVVTITNTSCVYFLTCVWVFCFLKVQKFSFLKVQKLNLALNYTKATQSRVGLVSCPF